MDFENKLILENERMTLDQHRVKVVATLCQTSGHTRSDEWLKSFI